MEPTQTPLTREQKVDFILAHAPMIRERGDASGRYRSQLMNKYESDLDEIYLNMVGDVMMGNIARADEPSLTQMNLVFENPPHDA